MAYNIVPQITKLNATNYSGWKCDIKFLLMEKNAYDIVIGNETKPKVSETVSEEAVQDFKRRQNAAMSILYLNIDNEFKSLISECTDPSEAWKILKVNFQPDSRSHHMKLFSEIMTCFLEPGESIGVFAARISKIADQLKSINKPIADEYLCFQVLRYLPDKFDQVVQQILRWPDKDFNFKNIIVELCAEETRLQLRNFDKSRTECSIEAQNVKFKRRPVFTCWRCGKKGHVIKDCKVKLNNDLAAKEKEKPLRSNFSKRGGSNQQSKRDKTPKAQNFIAEANLSSFDREGSWAYDTAASHHFCKDKSFFCNFSEISGDELHVAVDGVTFPITGKGEVELNFNGTVIKLWNVLYSPNLRKNLLSGSRFDQGGAKFIGEAGKINVVDKYGDFLFSAKLHDGIYYTFPKVIKNKHSVKLNGGQNSNENLNDNTEISAFPVIKPVNIKDFDTWHLRFDHLSPDLIFNTIRNSAVKGLPNLKSVDNFFCDPCHVSKQNRISFKPLSHSSSKKPLDRLFMDTWGPIKIPGKKGERFFLSIIDDFSGRSSVYPIQEKSMCFDVFKRHVLRAERFLGTKLKSIRTDNGKEFDNDSFKGFCRENGINHELTNFYTPEENGVCERFNQTIMNCVRAMLKSSGLSDDFWPEACLHFNYTWNRICHGGNSKTPFELYSGNKPSVRHLRPFGTLTYVGVPKVRRKHKLDSKSKRGVLVGYALRTRGYRVWLEDERKVVETINVSFVESGDVLRSGAVMGDSSFELVLVPEEQPRPVDRYLLPGPEPGTSGVLPSETEVVVPAVSPVSPAPQVTPQTASPNWMTNPVWYRKVVPRPQGEKVDIYYYPDGEGKRCCQRSPNDVKKFCNLNNIVFNPADFDFSKFNKFTGVVNPGVIPSASSTAS